METHLGINFDEAKAILSLKRAGQTGTEILCLGRPESFLDIKHLRVLSRAFGLALSAAEMEAFAGERFAEPFLARCGFASIRSLDASGYEGAEIVHDLNQPLPDALHGCTGFLYDGGTSEHVFDVAQTLRNMTLLLRNGGTLLISSPANGQCGHGFYQFSPELYYRYFSANGFADTAVYLVAMLAPSRWFRAIDPNALRRRVQFVTSEAVQGIVVARKVADLAQPVVPQQSDYSVLQWNASLAETGRVHAGWRSPAARFRALLRDRVVYPLSVVARHMLGLTAPGLWRRALFVPVDPLRCDLMGPAQGQSTAGGIEDKIDSTLPPVFSPKIVPRS